MLARRVDLARNSRLVMAIALVCGTAAAAPAAAATPEVFPMPSGMDAQAGIATAPDGAVWFAGSLPGAQPQRAQLGRLDATQAVAGTSNGMTQFPLADNPSSCCVRQVRDMTFDSVNGRVWFVRSDGVVGYGQTSQMVAGSTTGQVSAVTPGGEDLGGVALNSSGQAWITETSTQNSAPGGYPGNRTALATPQPGVSPPLLVSEKPNLPQFDSKPTAITVSALDTPFFVESATGDIASFQGSSYSEFAVGSNTQLAGIAEAPDASIWSTDALNHTVERLDPSTRALTSYAVDPSLTNGSPGTIRRAGDGTLWFTVYGGFAHPEANALVRVVPAQAAPTETVYPLGDLSPLALQPDVNGNVWFTATNQSGASFVGRFAGVIGTPAASSNSAPPPSPTGNGAPAQPAGPTSASSIEPVNAPATTRLVVVNVGVASAPIVSVSQDTINLTQQCVGPPEDRCALIYLVQSHEYVNGYPGARRRAAAATNRRRTLTVARRRLELRGGESRRLKLSLDSRARRTLRTRGRLATTLTVLQRLPSGKTRMVKTEKIVFLARGRRAR